MKNAVSISITGRAGTALRLMNSVAGSVVDRWSFTPRLANVPLYDVYLIHSGIHSDELMLTIVALVPDEGSAPAKFGVASVYLHMLMGKDAKLAREVTRYLMHSAAHGTIPMPPYFEDGEGIWRAAAAISAMFVERFGCLDDVRSER